MNSLESLLDTITGDYNHPLKVIIDKGLGPTGSYAYLWTVTISRVHRSYTVDEHPNSYTTYYHSGESGEVHADLEMAIRAALSKIPQEYLPKILRTAETVSPTQTQE